MPLDAQSPAITPPPAQTFGQACAHRIGVRKAARMVWNPDQPFTLAEVAAVIDEELAAYLTKQTPSLPVTAKTKAGTNIPPTPEEVTAYSASIGYPLDGQSFCDSYEVKGWLVGKVKMKNWQAAVRNWKQNKWGKLVGTAKEPLAGKDYSKF